MKIAVLNGSPKIGNTAAMVDAFVRGAKPIQRRYCNLSKYGKLYGTGRQGDYYSSRR